MQVIHPVKIPLESAPAHHQKIRPKRTHTRIINITTGATFEALYHACGVQITSSLHSTLLLEGVPMPPLTDNIRAPSATISSSPRPCQVTIQTEDRKQAGKNRYAPQAITKAAHNPLRSRVILLHPLGLAVHILQQEAYKLDHSHDEATESNGAKMIAGSRPDARENGQSSHVRPHATRPVVLANAVSNYDIAKADNELVCPEKTKEVVREHVLQPGP
jgi:hypothetical protein